MGFLFQGWTATWKRLSSWKERLSSRFHFLFSFSWSSKAGKKLFCLQSLCFLFLFCLPISFTLFRMLCLKFWPTLTRFLQCNYVSFSCPGLSWSVPITSYSFYLCKMPSKIDLVSQIEPNRNWVTYELLAVNRVCLSFINFSPLSKNFSSEAFGPTFQHVIIARLQLRDTGSLTWGAPNCQVRMVLDKWKHLRIINVLMFIRCFLGCWHCAYTALMSLTSEWHKQ